MFKRFGFENFRDNNFFKDGREKIKTMGPPLQKEMIKDINHHINLVQKSTSVKIEKSSSELDQINSDQNATDSQNEDDEIDTVIYYEDPSIHKQLENSIDLNLYGPIAGFGSKGRDTHDDDHTMMAENLTELDNWK